MTESEQAEWLKAVLADNAEQTDAIAWLQDYALRHEQMDEFYALLKNENRIEPLSTRGLMNLAQYYQAGGDYEKSLNDPRGSLSTVFKVSPDDFNAHRLAAIAYHALEDDENALTHVAKALEVNPSDRWCLEYQELLQATDENYATPYLKDWQDIEIPDA